MMLRTLWKEPERYVQELLLAGARLLLHERCRGQRRRRPLLGHRPRRRRDQRRRPPAEHDGNGKRHHGMQRRRRGRGRRRARCDQGSRSGGVRHAESGTSRRQPRSATRFDARWQRSSARSRCPDRVYLHRRAAEDAERQDHAPLAEGDSRDGRGRAPT